MANYVNVTTQAELDATLAAGNIPVACDSAHVEACGSAHVVACDSAHVVARDSAHVVARGSAHVEARDFVSVHCLSRAAKIVKHGKAAVIRPNYPRSPAKWCALKGIAVVRGKANLWKAVNTDGKDFYTCNIDYMAGGEIVAPDWDAKYADECGHGLHLADSPSAARGFVAASNLSTFRLLEVSVRLADCRCFPGLPSYPQKLRARACRVVREVPRDYTEEQSHGD